MGRARDGTGPGGRRSRLSRDRDSRLRGPGLGTRAPRPKEAPGARRKVTAGPSAPTSRGRGPKGCRGTRPGRALPAATRGRGWRGPGLLPLWCECARPRSRGRARVAALAWGVPPRRDPAPWLKVRQRRGRGVGRRCGCPWALSPGRAQTALVVSGGIPPSGYGGEHASVVPAARCPCRGGGLVGFSSWRGKTCRQPCPFTHKVIRD